MKRGQVYYTDFRPVVGSEQDGARPCVIIQNNAGNYTSPTIIVAIATTQSKTNLPTHVPVSAEDYCLDLKTIILLEQLRTIDKKRIKNYIGRLSDNTMKRIDEALCISLALNKKEREAEKTLNEIQNKDMRTPIEIALSIDENGMTTARALYQFLELAPSQFARWAKQNIENNEFYEENNDWQGFDIMSNGNKCKDYRLTTDFAKHLSMESRSERGKEARQYFVMIENRVKQKVIDLEQLDPQTKLMNLLVQSISRNELEQKRQAKQLNRIEQKQTVIEKKQEVITDTFQKSDDTESFQKWANRCITKIAESPKFNKGQGRSKNYSLARSESYDRLKQKRNCRLDDRVQKAIGRAIKEQPDVKKSELQKINKIYIIANDKDLRPAYELVIKEMMIYYCVA